MSKKTNNEINNIIQSVLQDYALTCGVTPFNGKVIITEDMAKSYLDLRSDLVQNGMSDMRESSGPMSSVCEGKMQRDSAMTVRLSGRSCCGAGCRPLRRIIKSTAPT